MLRQFPATTRSPLARLRALQQLKPRNQEQRPMRTPLALYLERHRQPRYVGIMGVVAFDGEPLVYEMPRPDLKPLIYLSSVPASLFWALDVLAGSFIFTNAPRHVGMYFITRRQPQEWWLYRHQYESPYLSPEQVEIARDFQQYANFILGYARPGSPVADNIVLQLAGYSERRSWGQLQGGFHLLLIEDLADTWEHLSRDARQDLIYLLQTVGGMRGIGVVAGLRYEDAFRVPSGVRALFAWQAWGALYGHEHAIVPADDLLARLVRLQPDEFWMNTSTDGWLRFHLLRT